MEKSELIRLLGVCAENADTEAAHSDADDLLVKYLNDEEITKAYEAVSKWYA